MLNKLNFTFQMSVQYKIKAIMISVFKTSH